MKRWLQEPDHSATDRLRHDRQAMLAGFTRSDDVRAHVLKQNAKNLLPKTPDYFGRLSGNAFIGNEPMQGCIPGPKPTKRKQPHKSGTMYYYIGLSAAAPRKGERQIRRQKDMLHPPFVTVPGYFHKREADRGAPDQSVGDGHRAARSFSFMLQLARRPLGRVSIACMQVKINLYGEFFLW